MESHGNTLSITQLVDTLTPIFEQNNVIKAAVFGSYARNQQHTGSDIDLLVAFKPGSSLFHLGGLFEDVQSALHMDVDIVTYNSLLTDNSDFARNVLSEAMVLYEAN